jgi:hypothetical protein
MSDTNTKHGKLLGCLLAVSLAGAAATATAAPWLSSPSSDRIGTRVEVRGGGFEPGATIELTVVDQNDEVVSVALTRADEEGAIHDDVKIGDDVSYVLEAAVPDSGGAPLATAVLVPGQGELE